MLDIHQHVLWGMDDGAAAERPVDLLKARKWLEKNTDAAYARALTTFSGELR